MSAATVGLPLTGSGGTTADVAVDLIGGAVYQYMKLANGTIGSTVVATVLATTPSAADGGLVVRPIMPTSTAQIGNVGQAQTSAGSSDNYWWVRTVNSAAGSTVVDVNNPTTAVTITNPSTAVTITNPTTAVTVSNPTTAVTMTNPTTAVDLSSAGSTRVVGTVNVTSGVVLGAGSSANTVGSVALVAGSSGNMLGQVAQGPGSTSIAPWYVISTAAAGAGSTTVDANLSSAGSTRVVGTVNVTSGVVLGAGSSANTLGSIAQGAGSTSVAPWYVISTASAGAGSTVVDAQASSVGSTKLFGQVTVANPTTAVTVSSGVILAAGSSANTLGAIAQGAGSTSVAPWYVISTAAAGAGSTTVDANLSSAGSTRVVGTVNVSSGVILGAGSSANTIGAVALVAGSSDAEIGGVNLTSGSTAFVAGAVVLAAGTTSTVAGAVALAAGSSAVTVGAVALVAGTTGNYQFVQSIAFSSGGVARTSVSTTVDTQLIGANANRKALVIANRSTTQTVGVGFSTAAVTTALANVDFYIGPASQAAFGIHGGYPLYLGPLRGINLTSTTVAGSVGVIEFS